MQTKLWDAQDALYSLINANTTLATQKVPVTLGDPGRREREHVWIGGEVSEWTQDYGVSGLRARDEEFVIPIITVVVWTSGDYVTARDRVKAIGSAIETTLAANPTLNGSVMLATITRMTTDEGAIPEERKRLIGLTQFVTCKAFVTP